MHKYLNIEMYNNEDKPKLAEYSVEFKSPILDCASNYKISIIRFNIPSSSIPIFIFEDNKYYVTLTYNNINYTQVLIYSNNSPAYGLKSIYHYQDFINIINAALTSAYNTMKTSYPLAPATIAPYITFDAITQLCTIWVEKTYENNIGLFFNSSLYTFFDNFNVKYYGFNNINKKDFQIIISDNKNNSSGSLYFFIQEYPSLFYWNDLRTIIFLTNLPIVFESNPADINIDQQNSNYIPLLTDFQPINTNNGELRSYLQYQPSIYRYTDMINDDVLRKLAIRIYWQDKKGNMRPLYFSPGELISVKIMFEHK